ncbi:L-histidine N(alpha)-methyltransferase [Rhabdobacter roseus]|uniref:Dimethylhistidine N-methyltransferase n=1 Tax=Rhabdobacter roseus TaxID=1655419 RepID=A0A840U653_9BACT|nr:L-histidine N(alpha)-methyltransferase [Rhabdobacter roseus]MBB5287540.1 dimethylhistidine N-methyltransferase [Rhabdobacter roseus]
MHSSSTILQSPFAEDVRRGLLAAQKAIPSKYFYDDAGSRLFQDIMQMPEYYLTRSEMEILSLHPAAIAAALRFSGPFTIVELGAGDGLKTKELLKYLVGQSAQVKYLPIDISGEAMQQLQHKLATSLPDLDVQPEVGDYFEVLERLDLGQQPSLFLFLGGNIGNYEPEAALALLRLIHRYMQPGDQLLTGFDLRKNPRTIQLAYDDPHGITRAFNLNLLWRINRELGGTFEPDKFDFYCFYNPYNGEVRSALVSLTEQQVRVKALDLTVHFRQNELIKTELSRKYTLEEVDALAAASGFHVEQHFFDCKHYFTDSLWVK